MPRTVVAYDVTVVYFCALAIHDAGDVATLHLGVSPVAYAPMAAKQRMLALGAIAGGVHVRLIRL